MTTNKKKIGRPKGGGKSDRVALYGDAGGIVEIKKMLSSKQRYIVLMQFINKLKRMANADKEMYPYVLKHNSGNNACKGPALFLMSKPMAGCQLIAHNCIGINGEVCFFHNGVVCGSCEEKVEEFTVDDVEERE